MSTGRYLGELEPLVPQLTTKVRSQRDYVAAGAVILLLYAGYFKANPLLSWVPVDLTFLGAALTLIGVIAVAARSTMPPGTGPVLALWATFIPAAILHAPGAYASQKVLYLFTLTLLSALGPLFLIRSTARQELWVIMQVVLAAVLAGGALLSSHPLQPAEGPARVFLNGSNTIASGNLAGLVVVACFIFALTRRRRRGLMLVLGSAAAVAMFQTGSRGPVLAVAAALAAIAAFAPASGVHRAVRVAAVGAVFFLGWYFVRGDTAGGVGRIASTLLAGSDEGTSSQIRLALFREAWAVIPGHFWGLGWGGLNDLGPLSGAGLLGQPGLEYPHDIFLEVTAEAGWIVGVAMIVFMWCGLRRLRRLATSPYPAVLFGMAVFNLVNSAVSGDINSYRSMWASIAIAWVAVPAGGRWPPPGGSRPFRINRTTKVFLQPSREGKPRWRASGWRPPVGRGLHRGTLRPGRISVRLGRRSTQTPAHAVRVRPSSHGRVRKASFTVLIGSVLGSAISLLVTPLVSRIFEPAVYGEFALITGVMSVFVGVSTFRLEVQSLRAADDTEAAGLIRLGLIASGAWGVALTIATGLAVALWGVDGYWLSTGVLVFLTSLQLLGSAVLTRAQRYRNLAAGNFVQGASFGVVQLLLGMISAGVGELIAGFGAARLCWFPALGAFWHKVPGIGALWRENRQFAAFAGTSAFINSLATSAPVLLASFFYGDAAVGQFAIGIRLLIAPLSIIGQAVASANIGEVSRMLRDGDHNSVLLVRRGMRDLLAVGLIPSGLAGILGTWAVPFVLGREWREAGLLLAVLSAGALAQFVVAPFSQLLNLTGNNRLLLIWDTGRFGATILSFCVARTAGMPLVWAIGFWSSALILLHIAQARMIFRAIVRYRAQ